MEDYETGDPEIEETVDCEVGDPDIEGVGDYEIGDPKTEEIMEASLEDSDEDVRRMHKEGMAVIMYKRDEGDDCEEDADADPVNNKGEEDSAGNSIAMIIKKIMDSLFKPKE